MNTKSNTISVIIFTILFAGGVFFYFYTGANKDAEQPLTASTTSSGTQARFQSLVIQLQSISFDTAIFSNPAFTSRTDITVPIEPEPLGRLDPFAPIE